MTITEPGIDLSVSPTPKPLPFVDYPTDRPNFCHVFINGTHYWFSYRTCIAFRRPGQGIVCRKNEWGPITAKHMHFIGVTGSERLNGALFEELLQI